MENLIKVKIDNSSVMDSIETANIKITSPTGRTIILYKRYLSNKISDKLNKIFWKCCKDPMIRFIGIIELTKDEMELALQFSQLRNKQ